MPELPEVETTRRGITPHVIDQHFAKVIVRQPRLRWPIPANLPELLFEQRVEAVTRRAKYLLFQLSSGTLMIHLGMSGSLRLVAAGAEVGAHDHVDFQLSNGHVLRYTDPRRFGAILWLEGDPFEHALLNTLGPEPLAEGFSGDYLRHKAGARKVPVKSFIMDGHVVVGVGNIYANEALYRAGIHPKRAAGRISLARYQALAQEIKDTLTQAIASGGTTLKDFVGGDGKPGYFKQSLQVYGRAGLPCLSCGEALKEIRLGQRSTVFCSCCQK
ncbi:MAG: bifunctional DNA-formamidopyrimidine glycosylase/DNA-(apurinic or apyrimidinic site) lyase [Pseudomonadales bacterium]